jgi:molybdate transport system ATP-binding protein
MSALLRAEGSALRVDISRRVGPFSLDVRFDCGREVLVLFGASGAGKSMTLECIAGLARPDRGEIRLGERALFSSGGAGRRVDLAPRLRRVGYVPQDGALFPHLTLAENVAYPLRFAPGGRELSAARLLDEVAIGHLGDRYPLEVSGGQARRAAIARALAAGSELLLLDEPFVHLDRVVQSRLVGDLVRLTAERGIPTVLVTHDLEVLAGAADRVVVLDAGSVVQAGTKAEVLFSPATAGVARLLGDVNVLDGVVEAPFEGQWKVRAGGRSWRVSHVGPLAPGDAVELLIRRSAVKVVREGAPLPPELSENLLDTRVVAADVRPDAAVVTFALEEGVALAASMTYERFGRHGLEVGRVCRIALDPEGVSLFVPPEPRRG